MLQSTGPTELAVLLNEGVLIRSSAVASLLQRAAQMEALD
jgi:hypothetical protein